jgi:recombination protein RecR
MNAIDRLTEKFRDFPGIGPRQSKRFVYFLLSRNRAYLEELVELIMAIKKEVRICSSCLRFFAHSVAGTVCPICADPNRDHDTLLLVEKDVDLENVEKSHAYNGQYFVMGGTIPILEKKPEDRVHLRELLTKVKNESIKNGLKEIIVAFSVNAEGENTGQIVEESLRPLQEEYSFKISHLGRGLSTGSELEYADGETLKSAFKNRF